MGEQFNARQHAPAQHEILRWVPRSSDMFGGGNQGMTLIGLVFGEDVLFNALQIRDTTMHQSENIKTDNPTGEPYDQAYAPYKTIFVVSTLNQTVSLQPVWTRDMGQTWYPLGSAVNVPAYSGTGSPQSAIIVVSSPSQYIPFVGLQATCATEPSSGQLDAWLERLG
ncbi:MAG: hypothetical protein K6T83_03155 [Alicyclobacillus sp.]|nr:hypothetical protein [Alicyclobacillus sp.]